MKQMNKKLLIIIPVIIVVVLGTIIYSALFSNNKMVCKYTGKDSEIDYYIKTSVNFSNKKINSYVQDMIISYDKNNKKNIADNYNSLQNRCDNYNKVNGVMCKVEKKYNKLVLSIKVNMKEANVKELSFVDDIKDFNFNDLKKYMEDASYKCN